MTDVRFLSNNSVTSEVNHVKCKTLMQGSSSYKSTNNCKNRSKGSPRRRESLPKSGNFPFWGRAFPRQSTDWREILHDQADTRCAEFHLNLSYRVHGKIRGN